VPIFPRVQHGTQVEGEDGVTTSLGHLKLAEYANCGKTSLEGSDAITDARSANDWNSRDPRRS
jgi:hypothetical protein